MIGFTQDGWDRHLLSYPIVAHSDTTHAPCALTFQQRRCCRFPYAFLLFFFFFSVWDFPLLFLRARNSPTERRGVRSVGRRPRPCPHLLPSTSDNVVFFFLLRPPVRPSNKQTKRRKKRPLVFSFFLFFVSSPFSIFLSCKRERRKKNEGRTTFERRALEVWNLISEISVFKSFFISGRDNLAKKIQPIQFEFILNRN